MGEYRSNANDMSVQDQLDELSSRIDRNSLRAGDLYSLKVLRNVIGGILAFLFISCSIGYGCNHDDNKTKLGVAKMCPTVSPNITIGLKESK